MGKSSRKAPDLFPAAAPANNSLWISLGLAAAVFAVYLQTHRFDFVSYDDVHYLKLSPYVSSGLTIAGIKWAFTTFYFVNWHPLTWLSYMLDVEMYGRSAGGMHLTNLLLHAAGSVLLFRALRRMTGAELPSALTAALFAVHPLHVESVAWVSERKDVLCGLFLMLALNAYGVFARRPSLRGYVLTAGWFMLGLMSKPMIVTFPFLLLLLDFWPLRRWTLPGEAAVPAPLPAWRLVAEKTPLLLLSAISCAITIQAQSQTVARFEGLSFAARFANAATSYVRYIAKTVWPSNLSPFYPYPSVQSGWIMLVAVGALFAASYFACREARRRPYLVVGWFWFLGTLVPMIGLVQVGDQSMADRYSYVPSIGLFIMAAWATEEYAARRPDLRGVVRAVSAAAVAALAVAAHVQTGYWRDDKSLWSHALSVTRGNYVAETGLGTVLLSEGNLREAGEHFQRAVELQPYYAQTYNTLGVTLMKFGHIREALPYLERAVKLKPAFAEAHSNLGLALAATGQGDGAIAEFKTALRLEPNYPEVLGNLAIEQARQGRLDESCSMLLSALRIDPEYADGHYNLAVVLFKKGRDAEAVSHLRTALRLKPDHEDARVMLTDLDRRATSR